MISIALYNSRSTIRIVKRALAFLSKYSAFRTTEDTIWVDGLYISFSPKMITVNNYSNSMSKKTVADCLNYILDGEEIFVPCKYPSTGYYGCVDAKTNFVDILTQKQIDNESC